MSRPSLPLSCPAAIGLAVTLDMAAMPMLPYSEPIMQADSLETLQCL